MPLDVKRDWRLLPFLLNAGIRAENNFVFLLIFVVDILGGRFKTEKETLSETVPETRGPVQRE